MPLPTHPDLEVIKFEVRVEGKEPVFVQVAGADSIDFKIPENSKYVTVIHFKVKNRSLKNLRYKQVVKKGGFALKTKEIELGDYEPSDEIYAKETPEDTTPGGFMFRGSYPAESTYYVGDEELYTAEWSLEITKK